MHLLKDALNEYAYDAEIAGVDYKLELSTYGMMVCVGVGLLWVLLWMYRYCQVKIYIYVCSAAAFKFLQGYYKYAMHFLHRHMMYVFKHPGSLNISLFCINC